MDPDALRVILVAVDLSAESDDALRTATAIAHKLPDCRLHLVHVVSGELDTAFADDRLATWAARHPKVEGEFHTLRRPDTAEGIVELAAKLDADIVVVGTSGRRGIGRLLLGSVAESVVRSAPCPVLVTRAKQHAAPGE